MSIVNELIDEVVDSSSDLGQVLRKAKILASELGSKELRDWAEAELGGYKNDASLPSYRVSAASNLGNFVGLLGRYVNNFPIPVSSLPEKRRDSYLKLELREGVASLAEMLNSDKEYAEQWNADFIALVADEILENMTLMKAWKVLPKARIAGVLDSIRNRLLNFLLDLKEHYPQVEGSSPNFESIPNEDVRVTVINNIYGGSNVLASGSTVHQSVQQGIEPGDIESLLSALRKVSIPDDLVDELSDAINDDDATRKGGVGEKVRNWLTKLGERVVSGSAVSIATQMILQYYGLLTIAS